MRIRSLMKRSQVSDTLIFGNIEILSDENRCLKAGKEVKLSLKERQILMELVDAQGITVTRADIIETIW
jgi:DNA-binding response OmpR family regulator